MPVDLPFDPDHYASPDSQAGLIADAFVSGDVAFVVAALRAVLQARRMDDGVLGLDPRLSAVLAVLDTLQIELLAAPRP